MEKIKQRSMTAYVLSFLINTGIGLAFGLVLGIVVAIFLSAQGMSHAGTVIPAAMSACAILVAQGAINLYWLYFYYRLSIDVNRLCEGDGEENSSFLVAMTLSFLTFGIYWVFWTYKLAKRLRANAPQYGVKMLETGKEIAVLSAPFICFGFIGVWELIKYTNKVAEVFNQQNGLGGVE